MDHIISKWIGLASTFSPFLLNLFEFCLFSFMLLFLFKYFEKLGIIIFMAVTTLVGNIQILTLVDFNFTTIPLGTIAFSMLFLASNLVTLHYDKKTAQKAIFLIFYTQIFFTCIMIMTMGYQSIPITLKYHNSIKLLFSPSLRLFSASLISYVASQLLDIHIFSALNKKSLFIRFNLATWVSALLDNTLFSFLAFYFFTSEPYAVWDIIVRFIFGTYWIRVLIGLLETPLIYASTILKSAKK